MENTLLIRNDSDEPIDWEFRASGQTEMADDDDTTEGRVARGKVGGGTDPVRFNGVPLDFHTPTYPAKAWDLDLRLDMGGGPVEWMPTYLNAATITVRSEGAHYILSVPGPGEIHKGETADPRDGVTDEANRIVAGNVRGGGTDEWRVWPPVNVSGVADGKTEYRNSATDDEWQQMNVLVPLMGF